MKRMSAQFRTTFVFAIISIFFLLSDAKQAQSDTPSSIASLYSLQGSAEYRVGQGAWSTCTQGQDFALGDEIRVGESSRAGVQFSDGMFIRLGSRASLRFNQAGTNGSLFLGSGKAHFLNRGTGAPPAIETSVVTAAIRGTEFVVDADKDSARIAVIEGAVEAFNQYGSSSLASGEQAVTLRGHAPQKSILLSPTDAVQWTAEVPVVYDWSLYQSALTTKNSPHLFEHMKSAVLSGNYSKALAALRTLSKRPALLSLLEVEILLSAGQIEEATQKIQIIDQSQLPQTAQARASAYLSLLALTRNDVVKADQFATQAAALDTNSVAAALAASYAAQAKRDLPHAREILTAASKIHPDEALLLSRLAELELGFGDEKAAQSLVNQALALDSNFAYALTVQGFIKLQQKDTEGARSNFHAAIANQPGLGLAFLGLGLSKIYDGDLEAGRADIERAVHLEPTRAVFRSYLGKAFFELEDEESALKEYNEAIRLDPQDPTAWLYRGFSQISKNRLVNALQDVEHSFALNDNRAVFRSTLLLDEDLAVKSAGLSKVFTELGFDETGRLEAIRALGNDHSNFSAHRLLADSQQEIFYADASFSERRIADLLAPLSFNLFSGLGGRASLNEYDALFDKSERRTGLSVGYDEQADSILAQLSHSGKTDTLGYAMSATTNLAGGSKDGRYDRDYRADGALRYQLAPDHRVLLDVHGIYRKIVDPLAESQEIEFDTGGAGLGYSYRMSASSTLLAEATIAKSRLATDSFGTAISADSTQIFEGLEDTLPTQLFLDQRLREYVTSARGGSQFIYHGDDVSLVAGFQLIHQSPDRNENSIVIDDDLGELAGNDLELMSHGSHDIFGTDVYLYPTLHLLPWLDLTAGVVRSDIETELREIAPFDPETRSEGHWNPKVGLTATPLRNLTLRSAYFENLQKTSLEDQVSIEPTLIGGLTQRFNDLSGTFSRNLGFGADYKIPGSTYFGAEYVRRHLSEPGTDAFTEIITDIDLQEQYGQVFLGDNYDLHLNQDFGRAYVYQVICQSLVGSLDYRYGKEELTDPEIYSDFESHRVSAQLKYFHSSGVFVFTRGTWRKQRGINNAFLSDGDESVTLFDAGLGYRLPKRRGLITLEFLNLGGKDFLLDQTKGFENYVAPDFGLRVAAAVNF